MKKLLLSIIFSLIVCMNSVVVAWYSTYYNGDFNYVLATGRMGGCYYVKLDSVREEYRDDRMRILSFDDILLLNGDFCNVDNAEVIKRIYKFDERERKMFVFSEYGVEWYQYDVRGPAFNGRGITHGEIAYATMYGGKFTDYFDKEFYGRVLQKNFDKVPFKILGRWYKLDEKGYFDIDGDVINYCDSKGDINEFCTIDSIAGLVNLRGMNRYKVCVSGAYKPYDVCYYDLAKEKILVIDNGRVVLHRTNNDIEAESIGGISIGMKTQDVIKKYGMPTSSKKQNQYIKMHYYDNGLMIVTECAGYVARVQIKYGCKKTLDKSGIGVDTKFSKERSWVDESLEPYRKVYNLYSNTHDSRGKREYPNRFYAGDGTVVVKQCGKGLEDIILVAESWLE